MVIYDYIKYFDSVIFLIKILYRQILSDIKRRTQLLYLFIQLYNL